MPADFRVEVDTRNLRKWLARLDGAGDDVVGKLATDTQADIQTHFSTRSPSAPGSPPGVDTGLLKNSIRAERVKLMLWKVSAGTPYAVHLEFSTARMAARPFFRPALERLKKRAKGIIKDRIRQVFR